MRKPTRFESDFVNLREVSDGFSGGEIMFRPALRRVHNTAIQELVLKAKKGKFTLRALSSLRRSKFKAEKKLASELEEIAQRQYQRGYRQAESEVIAQEVTQERIAAAEVNKRDKVTLKVGAQLSVGKIWQRLLNEGIEEAERLIRAGITGPQFVSRFQSFLNSLSTKSLRDQARGLNALSLNAGRSALAREAKSELRATHVLRSELLDEDVCTECSKLDGVLVEIGSPEFEEFKPPNRCLGGGRCRGFYVVVTRRFG